MRNKLIELMKNKKEIWIALTNTGLFGRIVEIGKDYIHLYKFDSISQTNKNRIIPIDKIEYIETIHKSILKHKCMEG